MLIHSVCVCVSVCLCVCVFIFYFPIVPNGKGVLWNWGVLCDYVTMCGCMCVDSHISRTKECILEAESKKYRDQIHVRNTDHSVFTDGVFRRA